MQTGHKDRSKLVKRVCLASDYSVNLYFFGKTLVFFPVRPPFKTDLWCLYNPKTEAGKPSELARILASNISRK